MIFDYLSSDGWKSDLSEDRVTRFSYQNPFATLSIELLDKGTVIYSFSEGEIQSLIRIECGNRILELLKMIAAEKKDLSSGKYAENVSRIIDSFPQAYYFNGTKYVLLVNKDMA